MSDLIFPYYIDQARLFDIYAILNDGYSEYEELCYSGAEEMRKNAKGSATLSSGFKMFKIGGGAEGSLEKNSRDQNSLTARRVQTTTSMMSLVLRTLKDKGYISPIEKSAPGSFVLESVQLRINSIKSLVDEAKELVRLSEKMVDFGKNPNVKNNSKAKSKSIQNMEAISSVVHQLFGSEEIVHVTDSFAMVGNVSDEHFYQADRSEIIGSELQCLAQVTRVYPNGTQLLRNTTFSKISDANAKRPVIDSIVDMARSNNFNYEASEPILEIVDKPVYEIKPIALFQFAVPCKAE